MNISHLFKKLRASDWSYPAQVYALGLVIGVALVAGIGLQVAEAWTSPTGAPPDNGNISAPITTSSVLQTKTGSLGIGGNLTLGGLFELDHNANYDVYIRGKYGAITRRALLGRKGTNTDLTDDVLYVNQGSDYIDGTIIGGPVTAQTKLTSPDITATTQLTSPKICLPNSNASNCRTSWPATTLSSYNDLPTGATAGYCASEPTNNRSLEGTGILPGIASGTDPCTCVPGWVSKITGQTEGGGLVNAMRWTCIKS